MEMFEALKKYITTTPKEVLNKEWAEIRKDFPEGINAYEYIKYSDITYWSMDNPPNACILGIDTKITPNYSGLFFLGIIVYARRTKGRFSN